jgi:hypothetical protein
VTDTIAFQAERFSTSVQFTYEIQPRPPDIFWDALRHKKRSKIRRAKEVLTTIAIDDPELYWNFYESNLKQRGIRDFHYDKVTTSRLIEACFARGCGRIYAAKDAFGFLVAPSFVYGMRFPPIILWRPAGWMRTAAPLAFSPGKLCRMPRNAD